MPKRQKASVIKVKRDFIRVHGYDLSTNHAAIVQLDDGVRTNFWYITDLMGSAARSKAHGTRLKLSKSNDKHQLGVERLVSLGQYIDKTLRFRPDYVGIEGYAYGAKGHEYQLGEVGGLARLMCYLHGTKLRIHDPTAPKMFVAHDGICDKEVMHEAARQRWDLDFTEYDQPLAKPNKRVPNPKQNIQTSGDLIDAYAMAWLIWIEVLLRAGKMHLDALSDEKERRVFLRTTKTFPVNALARPWICRETTNDKG